MTRREALQLLGNGFGMLGLARVLHAEAGGTPLAPKAPHFPPKAQNVIFLFLNGGISQVDTFDPKPALESSVIGTWTLGQGQFMKPFGVQALACSSGGPARE